MKKNDALIGTCIDYTSEGDGVVKVDDFVFFVSGVIISEKIKFVVTKLNKNFGYGKLIEIIEASKERQEPACPYFRLCGGCKLQFMSEQEQTRFKTNLVNNNLARIGGIDHQIDAFISDTELYYRNKAQYPVKYIDNQLKMGFYRNHSNDIVDIDYSMIQKPEINEVYQVIRSLLPQYEFSHYLRHVLIKYALKHDEIMAVLIVRSNPMKGIKTFIEQLVIKQPKVVAIIQNINDNNNNVILGKKEKLLYGKATITEQLFDYNFQIASKSFFQVNIKQCERLYSKVLEYADLNGNETVVDLYCGVGSISLYLASKAKKVYGVEIVEDAIKNARINATNNRITNIEFICDDAGHYAQRIKDKIKVDLLVVDPPRKGLDALTIDSIHTIAPNKLIYVSCNPATLARDLKQLMADGYQLNRIEAVDMFPLTNHIETVVLMERHK